MWPFLFRLFHLIKKTYKKRRSTCAAMFGSSSNSLNSNSSSPVDGSAIMAGDGGKLRGGGDGTAGRGGGRADC